MFRVLESFRIKLRVGILAMFLLIMLPLTYAFVMALSVENDRAASEAAAEAASRISRESVTTIRGLFAPIVQSIDVYVALAQGVGADIQQPKYQRPMFQTLQELPNTYSIYYGFEQDGGFEQMVRLPKDVTRYAAYNRPPPASARVAVRRIAADGGPLTDQVRYLAGWGSEVGIDQTKAVTYDPRDRPWYLAAKRTDGIVNSGPYLFSSLGEIGVTLSRRITDSSGAVVGVMGVDVTLDALSDYLAGARVGAQGVVFIIDADGRLVAQSGPDARIQAEQNGVPPPKIESAGDSRIARAARERETRKSDSFSAPLDDKGRLYNVSFSPLPTSYGQGWTVGVAVARDDFTGHFDRLTELITVIGIGFILLSCAAIAGASLLITRPINALIGETEAIQKFELTGGARIGSHVTEIDALARALSGMKSSLRSFGRFVPKEVVREIVRDRSSAMLGGSRQKLTVLFSDLEKFSLMSEELPPEEVVERLSRYFEAMTKPIHRHNGVIDKFIGDAIMALWNAPSEDADHVANACRAVLACRSVGDRLNAGFAEAGIPPMRTRFGLHTGVAVVGKVGSTSRMQFTAFGAMVNLASRIEGMNKQFGTEILASGDVEAEVRGQFLFRPFGPAVAAGTTHAFPVFELLGEPGDEEKEALLAAWNEGFAPFAAGHWSEAAQGFTAFLALYPGDYAAGRFLELCGTLMESDSGWDGALHFDKK